MKNITPKALDFFENFYHELDPIIRMLFEKQNKLGLLQTKSMNDLKNWSCGYEYIYITYSDGNCDEQEIDIGYEDILNTNEAIKRYEAISEDKYKLERQKEEKKRLEIEARKNEFERREFERLRMKFENK